MASPAPFNLPQSLQQAFQAFGAGRIDVALKMAETIIKRFPREANAHYLLGNISHQKKEYNAAAKCYKKAHKFDKNNIGALSGLGTIALDKKDFKNAILHFKKAIQIGNKPDAALFSNLGVSFNGNGDIKNAILAFEKAMKFGPVNPDIYLELGKIYDDLGLGAKSRACYEKISHDNPKALSRLGHLDRVDGKIDSAIRHFKTSVELDPANTGTIISLGFINVELGNFKKAEQYFLSALEIEPDNIDALINIGDLLHSSGRKGDAKEYFEHSIKQLRKLSDNDILNFNLAHIVGQMYDKLGDYKKSFKYNKLTHDKIKETLIKGNNQYQPKSMELLLENVKNTFSVISPQSLPYGSQSSKPIFIVGMPRSGTSLLEQMLSSHSQVFGAGELREIPNFRKEIATKSQDWAEMFTSIKKESLVGFANHFLNKVNEMSTKEKYAIDKQPYNFQHVGLIRKIFPNATIIHNQRNAMDTCVSIYFQRFGGEMKYDHDMADIAHFYQYYNKTMDFWCKWDNKIIDVQYENLIADPKSQILRVLTSLDLEWEDSCINFHKTDRAVMTASRLQVRQPLYKSSVEKWRRYGSNLKPLIDNLGNLAKV